MNNSEISSIPNSKQEFNMYNIWRKENGKKKY